MPNTRLHVLAIEDDPDARANLCDILALDGHQVDVASSIAEALNRRDWQEISAVILDRRLPDGSGDSLLPKLRQLAPDAAIIIVTGHADWEGTVSALRYGATDYILKPIDAGSLRASLARVVRLREAEQRAFQAERLAAMGQMVTAISHESRNALQRLGAFVEELSVELKNRPELAPLLTGIIKAQHQLGRLFEELRSYGGPIKLDRATWNMALLWRQAWSDLESVREERDVTLCEQTQGVNLECSVDFFRVSQVFRNLFENALAACRDPVQITIRCSEVETSGVPYLRIAVCDNGPGLTKEQRQHVFDAFYTTKPTGTGLGMAIAKRFVEAHAGQLTLSETDHPSGAVFVMTLPRHETGSIRS